MGSLGWPGLAEPLLAPLLGALVLAFPYFSFLELGVAVHASSALHPLLLRELGALGKKVKMDPHLEDTF